MRSIRQIINFLVFSNLFVAIPLTCLTKTTFMVLGSIDQEMQFLSFVYLSSFFLYGFHRLWGLGNIPDKECSDRHLWAKNNRQLFGVMLVIAACGVGACVVFLGLDLIVPLVPAAGLALGYTIPFLPGGKKWLRLRDLSVGKIFLIALVVTYITAWLPFLMDPMKLPVDWGQLVWFGAERILFILAITIPFDIRDVRFDQRSGLNTIPLKLGIEKSKKLALLLLLLAAISTFFQVQKDWLSWMEGAALGTSYLIAGGFVWQSKPSNSEYFFSLGVEGTMVIQWGLLVLMGI